MNDEALFAFLKKKFGMVKRASKGWIRIKCPTCTPKDAAKMKRGVHPKTQYTKCFICENKISFEELVGNATFDRAATTASSEQEEHAQARQWPFKKITPINELASTHPAIQFLHKDQLYRLDDYWEKHQIGFISAQNAVNVVFPNSKITTADSICFPVYFNKNFVGWQLRYIPGTWNGDRMGKMKYLHVFLKGKYVFNYDGAKEFDNVVVVEGIKKALKFPNGVATLGKGVSEEQVQIIQQWPRITLMYDGEDVAQEMARKLALAINAGPRECVNIDPRTYGFSTPDEASEEQCQWAVKDAWNKYENTRKSGRRESKVDRVGG